MTEIGILIKLIALQAVVCAVIIFVLKTVLDRELEKAALECVRQLPEADFAGKSVVVISASRLNLVSVNNFVQVFKAKKALPDVRFLENPAIGGGILIEIEGKIVDFSTVSRVKHLFRSS